MKVDTTPQGSAAYPLKTKFQRHVLPVLLLCAVVLVAAGAWGGRHLVVSVYLEQASREAHAVIETLVREADDAATAWLGTFDKPHGPVLAPADWLRVGAVLDSVVRDRAMPKLKIYDLQGVIRYSSNPGDIGLLERGPALDRVLQDRGRTANKVDRPDGAQFELYIFLEGTQQIPAMVVEMYEPSSFLDNALLRTLIPVTLVPALMLLAIALLLNRMVGRAQTQLGEQRAEVEALQNRLEKLVSNRAMNAARLGRSQLSDGQVIDATLYFADVRDFTSYAESHRAEQVVNLLNQLISLQVRVIDHFHGDVDKIIGDAVLAVFTGDDRAERAVSCGQEVLRQCLNTPDLPRQLAVGIHDGAVVIGAIGAPDRQDYTVIGDAVNVAQRVCTLAQAGELLSDTRTLQRAGHPANFGDIEEHRVKGRAEALRVRRWRAAAADAQTPGP